MKSKYSIIYDDTGDDSQMIGVTNQASMVAVENFHAKPTKASPDPARMRRPSPLSFLIEYLFVFAPSGTLSTRSQIK